MPGVRLSTRRIPPRAASRSVGSYLVPLRACGLDLGLGQEDVLASLRLRGDVRGAARTTADLARLRRTRVIAVSVRGVRLSLRVGVTLTDFDVPRVRVLEADRAVGHRRFTDVRELILGDVHLLARGDFVVTVVGVLVFPRGPLEAQFTQRPAIPALLGADRTLLAIGAKAFHFSHPLARAVAREHMREPSRRAPEVRNQMTPLASGAVASSTVTTAMS